MVQGEICPVQSVVFVIIAVDVASIFSEYQLCWIVPRVPMLEFSPLHIALKTDLTRIDDGYSWRTRSLVVLEEAGRTHRRYDRPMFVNPLLTSVPPCHVAINNQAPVEQANQTRQPKAQVRGRGSGGRV